MCVENGETPAANVKRRVPKPLAKNDLRSFLLVEPLERQDIAPRTGEE